MRSSNDTSRVKKFWLKDEQTEHEKIMINGHEIQDKEKASTVVPKEKKFNIERLGSGANRTLDNDNEGNRTKT